MNFLICDLKINLCMVLVLGPQCKKKSCSLGEVIWSIAIGPDVEFNSFFRLMQTSQHLGVSDTVHTLRNTSASLHHSS